MAINWRDTRDALREALATATSAGAASVELSSGDSVLSALETAGTDYDLAIGRLHFVGATQADIDAATAARTAFLAARAGAVATVDAVVIGAATALGYSPPEGAWTTYTIDGSDPFHAERDQRGSRSGAGSVHPSAGADRSSRPRDVRCGGYRSRYGSLRADRRSADSSDDSAIH